MRMNKKEGKGIFQQIERSEVYKPLEGAPTKEEFLKFLEDMNNQPPRKMSEEERFEEFMKVVRDTKNKKFDD